MAMAFATNMVALARTSSIDAIVALEPGPAASTVKTPAAPSADDLQGLVPRPFAPLERGRTRSAALVKRMVKLVETMPWPARSRELQALLGISKDRFLRVANLALDMNLVRRTGQKGGVKYLPIKGRSNGE